MGEIGDALRERRMALKIDVHEVEEKTKIRAKYLRALENEEYDLLPGPAYVKSFLRTYAEYLGIDSRQLVDVYKRSNERRDEDPLVFAGRGSGEPGRRRLWIALALAVLVVIALLFVVGAIGGGST